MVEFARFAQIEALKSEGFTEDDDCFFYEKDPPCGGPSFLKDKNGSMHWVSCGRLGLINGIYLKEINEHEYVELLYENGKRIEYGLPRRKDSMK